MDIDQQLFPKTSPAIGTQTYVSVGFLIIVLGAAFAVFNQAQEIKSQLEKNKSAYESRAERIEWTMSALAERLKAREDAKSTSETWTDRDMLQWSVKLQRENPSLKVPEPPMHLNP